MPNAAKHVGFVVDSGCTNHIYPYVHDLVNVRPCKKSVSGVDALPRPCTAIGDMPVVAKDEHGGLHNLVIT
eukprot:5226671-Pleurochrysis_carterae.AAC.1